MKPGIGETLRTPFYLGSHEAHVEASTGVSLALSGLRAHQTGSER